MNLKLGRRSFLSSLGAAGAGLLSAGKLDGEGMFAGSKLDKFTPKNVDGNPIVPIKTGLGSTGNPWAELGVTPLVNINGTVTVIGGSVMKPEVMELIRMGNMHFCVIDELEAKGGEWLARLCKAPADMTGLIVGGAAAAAMIGYAGMMTEDYNERLGNIPDLSGFPKTEIIIQRSHRGSFDHQIRQTGAKLVVVEGRDEMIAAINPRTVAIHFLNIQSANGVSGPDTVAIAKEHGVYTFNDASADVPPKKRLWEYPAIGFDLTTFSGGKDICGPQAAGLLIGKRDLCRWALLNMSPQENRIGRVCKVGKETIFGLLKAVELFVNQDEDETLRMYDARAQVITDALKKFGVTALPRRYNPEALGNVTPSYSWTWDLAKVNLTSQEIMQKLGETKPVAIGAGSGANAGGVSGRSDPNWTGPNDSGGGGGGRRPAGAGGPGGPGGAAGAGPGTGPNNRAQGGPAATAGGRPSGPGAPPAGAAAGGRRRGGAPNEFGFAVWQLKDGEDRYIANRLVEIFAAAPKA